MRFDSKRQLRVEGLEPRMLLAADATTFIESAVVPPDHDESTAAYYTPGDANQDGTFDQSDIMQVLSAGKYLVDELAGWSEGDWNGDSVFDQKDVVAALQAGNFLGGASAAKGGRGVTQISGVGRFDTDGLCAGGPVGYDWFTMVMTGDLQGCWYTKDNPVIKDNGQPSGVYQERRGEEIFVETDDDFEPTGNTFKTTYNFISKYDPEFEFVNEQGEVEYGVEVHGRCQHPIVEGTGDFYGATGRVDFKDDVVTGDNNYRGHIRLLNGV